MKTNELQIGDLVINRNNNEIIHIFVIDDYGDFVKNESDCYCSERNICIDDIEPIHLTAEILEKNGFKTNNDHTLTGSCIYRRLCGDYEVAVRLLNGWITIRSFDDRWYDLLNVHFQPRYVHELQHALRLCGLDDLADNFKV